MIANIKQNRIAQKQYSNLTILLILILSQIIFIVSPSTVSPKINYLDGTNFKTSVDPWSITADSFIYDYKKNIYNLVGNVIIQRKNIKINADILSFNKKDMTIDARKGASILIGQDSLTCGTLMLNLEQETGLIKDGSIFLQENNMKITGSKIEKTGKSTYLIDSGSLTTCSSKNQTWRISGKTIQIKKGKYGTIKNAILRVKKIPIFYLPYFLFPTTKRQSGFLSPEIKYTNKTISYCQPLFLTIGKNSDITLYPRYEFNSGYSASLEYRYIIEDTIKGLIMIDWVKKKTKGNQQHLRCVESDRYWFRLKCDQKLPMEIIAKFGIDLVSDANYLEDYKDGYSGFDKTEQAFKKFMGKSFLPPDQDSRLNHLIISKIWPSFALNTALYWNDDAIKHTFAKAKSTLQKKTIINLDLSRQQLSNLPFQLSMNIKHRYLKSNSINDKYITEFEPRIYFPYTIGNFISIDMSLGSKQIMSSSTESKYFGNKTKTYDLKLDMFSEFSKVFKKKEKKGESLKHAIEIRAAYEYKPKTKQDCWINLNNENRIIYENSITYSITNSIISKITKKISRKVDKRCSYKQLLYFQLQQSFKEKNTSQPFSDITSELYLTLTDNFTLQTHTSYDIYNCRLSTHTSELYAQNHKNYYFMMGYLYKRNKQELLLTSVGAPLSEHVKATVTCGYDRIKNKKLLESLCLYYNANCWAANIIYKNNNEKNSSSISFSIELAGLGNHQKEISQKNQYIPKNISLYAKQWSQ